MFLNVSAIARRFAVGALCVAALWTTAHADSRVRWTDQPPTIDGKGDDPAWKLAEPIAHFRQSWLVASADSKIPKTTARFLWDREYLYFLAECSDSDIVASITNHNGKLSETDVFEIFFQPDAKRPEYFEFGINAANAVFDAFFPDREAFTKRGAAGRHPFHVESKVEIQGTLNHPGDADKGWTVEGRVPWRDFFVGGGRPEPNDVWQFNLARIDFADGRNDPVLSATAPLQKPSFHKVEDYEKIQFAAPGWLVVGSEGRWKNTALTGSPEPPPPYRVERAYPWVSGHYYLAIATEPGTRDLIYLENTDYWGGDTKIQRFHDGEPDSPPETILQLPEKGYSICFHPHFQANGFIYFGGNGPQNSSPKYSRIVRYTIDRKTRGIDPRSRLPIIEWLSDGHNGAGLCFGNDGMLYVSSGDGSSDSDANIAGQDLSKLTCKILRLDVDHPDPGKPYSIPADNPFFGVKGVRPETWEYGCRNPWRMTSDPVSGQIWVGENGQDLWEYAYIVRRGSNHGWSVYEGSHPFRLQRKLGPDKPIKPDIEHPHSEFRSLTGGIVYRGRKYPSLAGVYIYGDFSTGRIWGALHDGAKLVWHRQLATSSLSITGFGADPDGEVLVVDHTGAFYRLEAETNSPDPARFPKKLSDTGLFGSLESMEPLPGVLPYNINAPQWADGAAVRHWMAVPEGASVDATAVHSWNFPNGAVLVQQLEWTNSIPGGRPIRLETRLLTRNRNDWAGYTYIWRADQKDADLVGSDGDDVALSRWVPGDTGPSWHVPGRAECIMCHSRAANFALGTTLTQVNHARREGGNDLETLESGGILRVDGPGYESWRHGFDGLHAEFVPPRSTRPSILLPRAGSRLLAQANPYDAAAPLEARVRSYLSANCAQCHVMSGGGNSAMDFDYFNRTDDLKILNVAPQHWNYEIDDAKIVAPGLPEKSILYKRLSQKEQGGMPPLALSRVDDGAAKLVKDWILSLNQAPSRRGGRE